MKSGCIIQQVVAAPKNRSYLKRNRTHRVGLYPFWVNVVLASRLGTGRWRNHGPITVKLQVYRLLDPHHSIPTLIWHYQKSLDSLDSRETITRFRQHTTVFLTTVHSELYLNNCPSDCVPTVWREDKQTFISQLLCLSKIISMPINTQVRQLQNSDCLGNDERSYYISW